MFLSFRPQSHTQLQWKVMECFRNSVRKMWSVCTKTALIEKIFQKKKNSQAPAFCCSYVNLSDVKIWRQSDKLSMSFSSLQCPLHMKKLIRKNSAKYVNQTGNFYFRPKLKTNSLPIFNLFPWFLFYIRYFILIITLTGKS